MGVSPGQGCGHGLADRRAGLRGSERPVARRRRRKSGWRGRGCWEGADHEGLLVDEVGSPTWVAGRAETVQTIWGSARPGAAIGHRLADQAGGVAGLGHVDRPALPVGAGDQRGVLRGVRQADAVLLEQRADPPASSGSARGRWCAVKASGWRPPPGRLRGSRRLGQWRSSMPASGECRGPGLGRVAATRSLGLYMEDLLARAPPEAATKAARTWSSELTGNGSKSMPTTLSDSRAITSFGVAEAGDRTPAHRVT